MSGKQSEDNIINNIEEFKGYIKNFENKLKTIITKLEKIQDIKDDKDIKKINYTNDKSSSSINKKVLSKRK